MIKKSIFQTFLFPASLLLILSIAIFTAGCSDLNKDSAKDDLTSKNFSKENNNCPIIENIISISDPLSKDFKKSTFQNVVRNHPLLINGNLSSLKSEKVQLWVFDGNITSYILHTDRNNMFKKVLDSDWTNSLPGNFTSIILVEYPGTNGEFAVTKDSLSGEIKGTNKNVSSEILKEINTGERFPTMLIDLFEQAVSDSDTGGMCFMCRINSADGWIDIDSPYKINPHETVISGNTTLPLRTKLAVGISTVNIHPSPKNYDYSHEFAEGEAEVVKGDNCFYKFSTVINTSKLNSGKYFITVESLNSSFKADSYIITEIINLPEKVPEGNYINWSALLLPELKENKNINPQMPAGNLKIVPPGDSTQNNEVEYGSIIDCGADGICRVFDNSGTHLLSLYDSNELHTTQVPNNAMADSKSVGNVTLIKLNGDVILTRINEYQ